MAARARAQCVFCDLDTMRKHGIFYEDEHCIAILDKFPISRGHSLVIPKGHFENMLEAPDEVVKSVYTAANKVAKKIMGELHPGGMNVTTNIGSLGGQYIMHFHVHVIPRYEYAHRSDGTFEFNHHNQIPAAMRAELLRILKL